MPIKYQGDYLMKAIKIVLAIAVSALSFNASAAWFCSVHNGKGQTWNGDGATRSIALSNAMGFCSKNSVEARNCVVNQCSVK